MKKLYSLFALIALLFTASGCEDDYRSMVLFEGVEPIYQIGTCDNLVSNLSYYLSETNEDTVLGIDGGECTADGKFSLDACRCIGACGLAPVVMIGEKVYGRLQPVDVKKIIEDLE